MFAQHAAAQPAIAFEKEGIVQQIPCQVVHIVSSMLAVDPNERPTPTEILWHPFIQAGLRAIVDDLQANAQSEACHQAGSVAR